MMEQRVPLIRIVQQMEIAVAILLPTTEHQDAQLLETMLVGQHGLVTKIISWIIQAPLVKLNLLPTKNLEPEAFYRVQEQVF